MMREVWVPTRGHDGEHRFWPLHNVRPAQVLHVRVPCRDPNCPDLLLVAGGVDLESAYCPRHVPVVWRGSA